MARILLVEDTDSTRRLKEKALTDAGFGVDAVIDGERALRHLAQGGDPDAIISDLNQRGFEGYDLVHVLRGCFKVDLLTSTPALERRFAPRIAIAKQYAQGNVHQHVPQRHKRTPLILTSSGPTPTQWPWKKYPPGYKAEPTEWQRDNAEVLHYTKALELADGFFVVEPVGMPFTDIRGMDAVIQCVRKKLNLS